MSTEPRSDHQGTHQGVQLLRRTDLDPDPIEQFGRWFEQALGSGYLEPTAMTLATVDAAGRPSIRTVLLKDCDENGFVFYTNYGSRKGYELAGNPEAALNFWWDRQQRQVRIAGSVEKVSAAESDRYFAGRPRGSQIGAWASPQSRVLTGREELEQRVQDVEAEYQGKDIPRPGHWGGYRLSPYEMEFWQGRASRLHDRFRYRKDDRGVWSIERLSP